MLLNTCPADLARRSFGGEVSSTVRSFKSWNTCMDNKTCKIMAITGIVAGSIIAIWIVGSLLRCFKTGVTGLFGFLCWPCCLCRRAVRGTRAQRAAKQAYNQPPPQVIYQPIMQPHPHSYNLKDSDYYSERPRGALADDDKFYELEAQKYNSPYGQSNPGTPSNKKNSNPIVCDEDVDHREELLWSTQRAGRSDSTRFSNNWTTTPSKPPYPADMLQAPPYTPHAHA